MRAFCVSSAQIDRLVKKRQQGTGLNESIDNPGKKVNHIFFNEVKEDLKFFISNVPKYSSNYSTEKDTTNM